MRFTHCCSYLGPPADEWTLKQHLAVNLLKDLVGKMRNYKVEDIQKINHRPTPLPENFKSIPFTIPDSYRESATEKLAPLLERYKAEIGWNWQRDECEPITGEWIIHEDVLDGKNISDVDAPTILYYPGGAYHICSIQTHRFITTRAAKVRSTGEYCSSLELIIKSRYHRYLLSDPLFAAMLLLPCPRCALTLSVPNSMESAKLLLSITGWLLNILFQLLWLMPWQRTCI